MLYREIIAVYSEIHIKQKMHTKAECTVQFFESYNL